MRQSKHRPWLGNKERPRFSGQAKLLLTVHLLFAVASALSATFVNVFLWKVKNDFALIGWFWLAQQMTLGAAFLIGGKWVKEHNKMNALRTGIAVSALFYLFVLLLGKRSADYVLLLGCLHGIGSGLFWLAFNVVYFEITSPENRDRFNGFSGFFTSGSNMVAPWIAGMFITRLEDPLGYRVIFSISLSVFVVAVIFSFFLKKRKLSEQYHWTFPFSRLRHWGNPWRRVFPALVAQGTREGVFSFVIALLVYVATQSELKLGNYSFITSGTALLSFILVGRWIKREYRSPFMLLGSLAMALAVLPFFWKVNYVTLLLFGLGSSLFFPFFVIPITSTVFDLIGRDQTSVRMRVEYVVFRELALNLGRILGTLLFIVVATFYRTPQTMNWLLFSIGSVPIFAWYFLRRLHVKPKMNFYS